MRGNYNVASPRLQVRNARPPNYVTPHAFALSTKVAGTLVSSRAATDFKVSIGTYLKKKKKSEREKTVNHSVSYIDVPM